MRRDRAARLLLSCRDANGAQQIAPLVREARKAGRYDIALAADAPALNLLRAAGAKAIEAGIRPTGISDPQGRRAAIGRAQALLHELSPDAVIASSSGPDAGVDEALVAAHGPATSFVLQDFWGDLNDTFGAHAGHYFVLDGEGAALTRRRTSARVIVTGMPKYADYPALEPETLRDATRTALGADDGETIVSFFGQPLWNVRGYSDLVRAVIDVVAKLGGKTRLLLRAHPRDQSSGIGDARRYASSLGLVCEAEQSRPVENALAAADVVVSAFSTCCYDAIVLARSAKRPLATALYFLPEPLWKTYCDWTRLDYLPPVRSNVALLARSADELRTQIPAAVQPARRAEIWNRSRSTLPAPGDAPRRILDAVDAAIRERREHSSVELR